MRRPEASRAARIPARACDVGADVNLKGGLPIIVDGITIGGIGVGSQTGEEDLEVAQAGLRAIAGAVSG